eukprot:g77147.t1
MPVYMRFSSVALVKATFFLLMGALLPTMGDLPNQTHAWIKVHSNSGSVVANLRLDLNVTGAAIHHSVVRWEGLKIALKPCLLNIFKQYIVFLNALSDPSFKQTNAKGKPFSVFVISALKFCHDRWPRLLELLVQANITHDVHFVVFKHENENILQEIVKCVRCPSTYAAYNLIEHLAAAAVIVLRRLSFAFILEDDVFSNDLQCLTSIVQETMNNGTDIVHIGGCFNIHSDSYWPVLRSWSGCGKNFSISRSPLGNIVGSRCAHAYVISQQAALSCLKHDVFPQAIDHFWNSMHVKGEIEVDLLEPPVLFHVLRNHN